MTARRRDEKFIKDLVIAGDDGKLYYLKESEWKARAVPLSKFKKEIKDSLQHGVALAAIPEDSKSPKAHKFDSKGKPVEPLGFCYLVSLASLKTHTKFEK